MQISAVLEALSERVLEGFFLEDVLALPMGQTAWGPLAAKSPLDFTFSAKTTRHRTMTIKLANCIFCFPQKVKLGEPFLSFGLF